MKRKSKNFSGLDTCPSKSLSVDNINLSFAGCGFNGIYHVGVASCFLEYCPKVSYNKLSGVSAGSLVATALACQLPLGESTSEILKVAIQARNRALGPFHPTFDVNKLITDALEKVLPEDAHKRVNGRLHISVTRPSDNKNVILTQFDSKEDLIQAVLCSCFIPVWSGFFPPKFHGVAYIDGGLSNNVITLDENTVTVNPFSGESDICPRESFNPTLSVNVMNTSFAITPGNIFRLAGVLFPPPPEVMSQMCQQGFDDALRFLQRNNKISCLRCVAIQSSFTVSESETLASEGGVPDLELEDHEFDGCADCERRRDTATLADPSLPDPVAKAIQDTCDQVNKGLVNWFFNHRPVKVLSIMTLPYVLPVDITFVILSKLWRRVPWMKKELGNSLHGLLGFTKSLLLRMEKPEYSATFSCQMSVTEYDYASENVAQTVVPPITATGVPSSRKSARRPQRLERSNTFGGHRRMGADPSGRIKPDLQRKSYAGSEQLLPKAARRSSVATGPVCHPPERILSMVNFGFTVDLAKSPSCRSLNSRHLHSESEDEFDLESNPSPPDVIETLKNLAEDGMSEKEISAVGLASRALNWEREHTRKTSVNMNEDSGPVDNFDRILASASKQEALLSFYYTDDQNRVKMTEIFKVPDDTEITSEQLQANWCS